MLKYDTIKADSSSAPPAAQQTPLGSVYATILPGCMDLNAIKIQHTFVCAGVKRWTC